MRPIDFASLASALILGIGGVAPASAQELGTISFPTSGAAEAQTQFIRGVLYLHSFEYASAAESFRAAQRSDPEFAMAYWGEAMTHTHPLWNEQDLEKARAILQRLGPTPQARRAKAPTAREQAYLAAVEALYGEGDKAERDTAYSLAMRDLVEAHPDDMEAKAFYALSLLGLSQGVRDVPTYMRAAATAQEVFSANPRHPGAAHYLIHSFDDPTHAPLGLPAARAYSQIAPDAPHAQHMTTHIFVALGMWDGVVSQNELATGDRWYPHHYSSWLAYGLLQQGRHGEAGDLLEKVRANMIAGRRDVPASQRSYLVSMGAHHVVNTQDWQSAALRWPIDVDDLGAETQARDAFAAGYAALRRGDRDAVEAALARLGAIDAEVEFPDEASVRPILERELRAAALLAAGDTERGLALLAQATALEDEMPVAFGPPVLVKPAHELMGEALLELGRPAEAQLEFEAALRLAPKRPLSLLGLARAAKAAGDEEASRRAYETLREVWHRADAGIPGLDEARRLAAAGS